jgi:TrmH family RNA methyltransferase
VIATSARERSTPWPVLDAEQAAAELVSMAQQAPVALVFGREKSGLNNAELDHCHRMVRLPANPDFSSLNLAAAVQVLSYELRLAMLASSDADQSRPINDDDLPASSANLQRLFDHFETTLLNVHFMPPHRAETLMRKLMRFYYRSGISEEEVRIFRGILSEMQRLAKLANDQVGSDRDSQGNVTDWS